MPLIIKCGASRKVSQDYQSQGYSLDVTSELDPRVLDDSNQLASTTNHLFALVNDLLNDQIEQAKALQQSSNGQGGPGRISASSQATNQAYNRNGGRSQSNGTYARNENGSTHGHRNGTAQKTGNGHPERLITAAQKTAIEKMAQRFDTNGDSVAREDFNTDLADLTIRQASQIIDRMKQSLEAQGGQGAGR
jgi:hypothetical protein